MPRANAPVQRPLPPPSRIESLIERQLEAMAAAMEDCFARARAKQDPQDIYDHERGNEISSAAKIAEYSAHLVAAVAKVRGQFDHRIHVQRDGGAAAQADSTRS